MIDIYPEVQTLITNDAISLRTKLVKEFKGKCYYWNIYRSTSIENTEDIVKAIGLFHKEVYLKIVLGKIDENQVKPNGIMPPLDLAYEQISEEERMNRYDPNSKRKYVG